MSAPSCFFLCTNDRNSFRIKCEGTLELLESLNGSQSEISTIACTAVPSVSVSSKTNTSELANGTVSFLHMALAQLFFYFKICLAPPPAVDMNFQKPLTGMLYRQGDGCFRCRAVASLLLWEQFFVWASKAKACEASQSATASNRNEIEPLWLAKAKISVIVGRYQIIADNHVVGYNVVRHRGNRMLIIV